MRYDFKKIEKKWKEEWKKSGIYEPDLENAKTPFYNLMMFPYPSAEGLHVGNMYAFVGADIYGRYQRMQGKDVFEPMGLDGFGIHSENYALKAGVHPAELAKKSEKHFYEQLEDIGNGFSWNERLETYDPEYYKWTQWIFTEMFRRGLAYRKKAEVNWCPSCKTVLADEQVLPVRRSLGEGGAGEGECERCATRVVRKELEQWFFKITDYAERLLNDLDKIDWSERVKIAQKDWIGKSEGALLKFPILPEQKSKIFNGAGNAQFSIEVFTTRPDTLFGATYLVLSPEHPWLAQEIRNPKSEILNKPEIQNYINKTKEKTPEERQEGKTGVELKGIRAMHPATKEEIPVWVADYVLAGYGTGAIMAVPAHDERDFEFAKKFKLPAVHVIAPTFGKKQGDEIMKKAIISAVRDPKTNRVIVLNWGTRQERFGGNMLIGGTMYEGEDPETAARREIAEETGYTDLKLVRISDVPGFGYFFSNTKNHNVFVETTGLYFELASDKQEAKNLDDGEHGKFTVEWQSVERVASLLDDGIHAYYFRTLVLGECYAGTGIMVDSGKFNGMDSEIAKWKITKFVGGERKMQYRLRDWLISRQRYWGPPIPLVFCEDCADKIKNQRLKIKNNEFSEGELNNPGWFAVPEEDLPVLLPDVENFRPTGTDKSPLATVEDFVRTTCPKCGREARRETDVSDTFLDSAWYYLRYPSVRMQNSKIKMQNNSAKSKNSEIPWNQEITKRWLPVDMYIGGAEHAVLHLLYTRFLTKVFHDWGLTDFDEPFKTFRAHGLLIKDGAKMSKSKGNVVNPDEYIEAWGADAMRIYLMFLGPFAQGGDFRDSGIVGMARFLKRVWALANEKIKAKNKKSAGAEGAPEEIMRILHQSIEKITKDVSQLRYNTAIAQLMILLNTFEKYRSETGNEELRVFLKLLAPFAPFMTEELWHCCGAPERENIHAQPWPTHDPDKAQATEQIIVVQINGRLRDKITLSKNANEKAQKAAALASEKVRQILNGAKPKRIIVVPGRLVNIVLS